MLVLSLCSAAFINPFPTESLFAAHAPVLVTSPLRNLIPHDPWKRNQLAVTVSAGFIFSGFTLIMPFVPMYVQMLGVRSQAAAAIWAGIALGISPLVASLAAPVWGRIADRYGLKIMAIRITFALFAIWALTAFTFSSCVFSWVCWEGSTPSPFLWQLNFRRKRRWVA